MPRSEWRKAALGVAAARDLLAKYEYRPTMPPPLVPDRALDEDLADMLRRLK